MKRAVFAFLLLASASASAQTGSTQCDLQSEIAASTCNPNSSDWKAFGDSGKYLKENATDRAAIEALGVPSETSGACLAASVMADNKGEEYEIRGSACKAQIKECEDACEKEATRFMELGKANPEQAKMYRDLAEKAGKMSEKCTGYRNVVAQLKANEQSQKAAAKKSAECAKAINSGGGSTKGEAGSSSDTPKSKPYGTSAPPAASAGSASPQSDSSGGSRDSNTSPYYFEEEPATQQQQQSNSGAAPTPAPTAPPSSRFPGAKENITQKRLREADERARRQRGY